MPVEDQTFWVAVSSIATSLAALLALLYVIFTYRLLRVQQDQSKPCVVVYTQLDIARAPMIMIVIENIGRSLARDVRFDLEPRQIPKFAFRRNKANTKPELMTSGPLINGIPALAPGESRRITWGDYYGLQKALGESTTKVTVSFKYGPRQMEPVESVLEVESFGGEVEWTDPDGARQCASQLKKIECHLQKMSRNQKG